MTSSSDPLGLWYLLAFLGAIALVAAIAYVVAPLFDKTPPINDNDPDMPRVYREWWED